MFRKILLPLIAVLLLSSVAVKAQMPGGRGQMGGQNMNMGHFYGKIVDSVNGKPLDAISVQLVYDLPSIHHF